MAGRTVKKDEKKNTWYYLLTFGTNDNGKPKQYKKRGFKTKQEGLKAMNDLEHALSSGTYIKPNKITYRQYMLEQWLEDKQTRVKQQTIATYRWLVELHILPTLGNIELSQLTPMMIQQLYNRLTKERSLSDENIQKVHTLINDSLKKTERWGLISRNPAGLVDRPKAVKKEIKVWNLEQVKTFLINADMNARYFIAPLLGLTTGMRIGEILGLRRKDIDLERGFIRVTQTLSSDGKELMPYTKTTSGTRTIDLPPETISYLEMHMKRIEKERKSPLYHDLDLAICTEFGTPTNKSNIRRFFNAQIKTLGSPKFDSTIRDILMPRFSYYKESILRSLVNAWGMQTSE